MPASQAQSGFGATFAIKTGGVFVAVAEVNSIQPPGLTRETIDVTHLTSDDRTKEFIGSLIEAGEATMALNYVPSASDPLLTAFTTNGGFGEYQITWPAGDVTMTFKGVITGYEPGEIVVDGKLTASLTVKCSGKPVLAAAAAPTNVTLPAIIGLAKVGVELKAYLGEWTGSPTLSVVWKNAGVAIAGATAATYTPVSGDAGDALTITVTGANGIGSASATSAATADVEAA